MKRHYSCLQEAYSIVRKGTCWREDYSECDLCHEDSVFKGLWEPAGRASNWLEEVKLGFTEGLTAKQSFEEVRVSHMSKV